MTADGKADSVRIILCADDYAMTEGVSKSIDELANAGRLSATSVIVTSRHWPTLGARARTLRGHIAVGLHINLTLGSPLGAMPGFAPSGRFSGVGDVTARALRGDIERAEIAVEVLRQIDAFAAVCGHPPDFIDGHQHVHALPGIRNGVLDALAARPQVRPPLIRDPADSLAAILQRGTAVTKAMALWWLARGFGDAARRGGFPVNESFAGVTDFAPSKTSSDFERAAIGRGPMHLVMCHPGYVDDELAGIDPVTERRRVEHDLLMGGRHFTARLWRPRRDVSGPPVDWWAIGASTP